MSTSSFNHNYKNYHKQRGIGSHEVIDNTSYKSRKELLKSSTKFANDSVNTLTLCNKTNEILTKKKKRREIIRHLNLLSFKVFPCKDPTCKNSKKCLYFHSNSDRRRSMINFKYVSELCPYMNDQGQCPYNENCKFSHNHFESLYHNTKYKRRFCIYYPDRIEECKYEEFCSYAHNEEEIKIDLLHNYNFDSDFFLFKYKTQFCPFSHIPHNRSNCIYAHNWQDLRRNPYDHPIEPHQCTKWRQKQFLRFYSEGCPEGSKCYFCHGWKEYEYHPLTYKVVECTSGESCQKEIDCPYYHKEEEKR